MPSVHAVLFDFGGVFMDSPFAAVRAFGTQKGIGPERVLELIFGAYDSDTDHPWHRLERGEATLVDARAEIIELGRREGVDSDPFHLFTAMGGGGMRGILVEEDHRPAMQLLRTLLK